VRDFAFAPIRTTLPVGRLNPSAGILRQWRAMCRLWAQGGVRRLAARLMRARIERRYGCYNSPTSTVGRGVYLPHPVGVVIGDTVAVGDGVTIYQHVTIGQAGGRSGSDATAYPVIGDGATLFAGCVVIGGVTVGRNATIGANAVVRASVPDGAIAVGVPARLIQPAAEPA
jgi:serine O-acetyltransferase